MWNDVWVLDRTTPLIPIGHSYNDDNLNVHDLILDDFLAWDEHYVRQLFAPQDEAVVLAMPFASHWDGVVTWMFEKTGMYYVKTGYIEWMKVTTSAYSSESVDRR
ncbi:hypothetical protein ACS0TY_030314 [Phlomoides rotata]